MSRRRPFRSLGYGAATGLFVRAAHLHLAKTGRITENLFAVRTGCVNFYVYRRDGTCICIDSGFGRAALGNSYSVLTSTQGKCPRRGTNLQDPNS